MEKLSLEDIRLVESSCREAMDLLGYKMFNPGMLQ